MLDAYMQPGPVFGTAIVLLVLATVFFFFFIKVNRKDKLKYDAAMKKYNKAMSEFEQAESIKVSKKSIEEQTKTNLKSYERCVLFMSTTGSCFDVPMNDTLTIGSNPRCNLHIDNDSVADMHCKILYKGGKYYLNDLGSKSGTTYDGELIAPESTIEIKNGLVQFGKVSFMMTLDLG
ncbi:MAG: FHA domain-containing protein [Saccharofermentans sp.]|nr:FHA domain-containing protein [Saccharofermentans sp.]